MAIFFGMPGNEELASELARLTCGDLGKFELRHFPDGETYVRLLSVVARKDVFVVCTLAHPDTKLAPLVFTAATIRGLAARRVQLIAPYLAYMRQDRIFHSGEALTSRFFAELLQRYFDGLITVDPHLHRHVSLDEIYDMPSTVVHAGSLFASWIAANVQDAVVIGPDAESSQWVEAIAREAGAPWTVFDKIRSGDRKVSMTAPRLKDLRGRNPVLIDDIVSSGTTMKRALRILSAQGFPPAHCLAVHGLCSPRTAIALSDGTAGFRTSNTVPNKFAKLDVAPLIADALAAGASRA